MNEAWGTPDMTLCRRVENLEFRELIMAMIGELI